MRLNDNQYKTLKWLVTVVLPALIVFIGVILSALDVPNSEVWLTILAGFEVFLGSIFKHAEYRYDQEKEREEW